MVTRTTSPARRATLPPCVRHAKWRRGAVLGACLGLVAATAGCSGTGDVRCALTGTCPSAPPRVASSAGPVESSSSQTVHFHDINYSIATTAGGRTRVSVGTGLTTDRSGDQVRYVFNHALRMEQTRTKGPAVFGALQFTVLARYPRGSTACKLPDAVADKEGCWLGTGTVAPFQNTYVPGYAGMVPEPLSYLYTGESHSMTLAAGAANPLASPTRMVVVHSTLKGTPATIAFPGQCIYTQPGPYGTAPTAVRPVSPADPTSAGPTNTAGPTSAAGPASTEPTQAPETVRYGAFPGSCKGLPTSLIGS